MTITSTPISESELDTLTRELTAFESFAAMLNTDPTYRPTIFIRDERYAKLADAYDVAMMGRGDPRRAFRGSRDLRPAPVTLTVVEVAQLVNFLDYNAAVITEGGWDEVESAWTKLTIALEAVRPSGD